MKALTKTRRHIPSAQKVLHKALPQRMAIWEPLLVADIIKDRQERGIDKYDEVWDGVYVMPPLATNPHQGLVSFLTAILFEVVQAANRGQVFAGANVSDRRSDWKKNFRCPDVAVILNEGRAVDCGTHWYGGPDFLIEIQSPGDETEKKIPFYTGLMVRELLIIQRDSRNVRLLRHDGQQLGDVDLTRLEGKKWLVSAVLPLAFRRVIFRRQPKTEVRRTDEVAGKWVV
jgi:Uma2 family endonuclease